MSNLPRLWSTDTTYTTGPDTGQPTKVNPVSLAGEGWVPGDPIAAQHVNFVLNEITTTTREQFRRQALLLRELRLDGTTVTDTTENMAAIAVTNGAALVLKTDVSWWVTDWPRPEALSPVDPIDTGVRDAARSAADRIVACGLDTGVSGGSLSFSDDEGGSWTAGGGGSGLNPHRIVYSGKEDRFIVSLANTDEVWLTDDGTTTGEAFPSSGLANGEDTNGVAVLNSGDPGEIVVICGSLTGAVGRPAFRRSLDGGATWGAGAQFGAGIYADIGCLCGTGDVNVFWAGTLTGGSGIHVRASLDGTSWSTVKELEPPTGTTFSTSVDPRLIRDPGSDLMVLLAPLSTSMIALYASDTSNGRWIGPQLIGTAFSLNAFAVAGGKLFATRNNMLFATDGILER